MYYAFSIFRLKINGNARERERVCRGMEHATQQVILETIRSVNRADRYTHTHTQIERDIYIRTRARFERCSTGFRFQLLDPPASSFGISLPRGWQIPRLEARERAPSLSPPSRFALSSVTYSLLPPSLSFSPCILPSSRLRGRGRVPRYIINYFIN